VSTPNSIQSVSEGSAAATRPARHHEIVVLGGGTGGITAAAQLCRKLKDPDIAIVEPSDAHYYQPLWTLVGGGVVPKEQSRKPERTSSRPRPPGSAMPWPGSSRPRTRSCSSRAAG